MTKEHSSDSEYNGCVVVVDDHEPMRQMLSLALETAGFDVVEAGSQLELQRHLAHVRPDALVLNMQRSKADGLALLTRMRARQNLADTPIIFIAGSDDDQFEFDARHAGADCFALRPLGMLDLQNEVARLIRQGRPTSEAGQLPTPIRRLKRTG
jgi:PleD family two-component response regulator